jgi:hypothetical protein
VVNGRVQYADGKLKVERGAGRFLKREVAHVGMPVARTASAGAAVAGRTTAAS